MLKFFLIGLFGLAAGAAQAQKLTVWLVGDDNGPKVLQPAVDAFMAKHPGVSFEVRPVPWNDAMVKLSAAIASASGPDIITGGTSYGIELGKRGGLVELGQKAPDLVAHVTQHGNPGLMRSVRGLDGSLHALPYDATMQLQYYRTDMVAQPPATWAAFDEEVARQRAAGARGFAQSWGNVAWIGFFPYLHQAGGALYDSKCTRALLDSPEATAALTYYASIYKRFKSPIDTQPEIANGLENGSWPLAQAGSWLMPGIDIARKKIAGRWSIAKLPAGPTGKSTAFIGGTVMAVTRYSPHVDLAVDFLRTVYSTPTTLAMTQAGAKLGLMWLPGGRQDLIARMTIAPERRQVLSSQMAEAEGPPNCPGWERANLAVTRAVQEAVLGRVPPAQALDKANRRMNAALAGP